jgi:multiple sugar transport system substrate-binding protein
VEYWTFWGDDRLAVVKPQMPVLEQRSGGITVQFTSLGGEFRDKFRTAIASGAPPDASISEVFSAALLFDTGAVLEITSHLKRDRVNLARDWVLTGYEDWCGKNYVFPLTGWSYAMAYNKSMFQERGIPDPWDRRNGEWTWDDFVEAAMRLTQDKDGDGRPDVFGFQVDGHSVYRGYHPFIATNGGEVFDYDQMRYTLDAPRTVEAVEWLADLAARRRVLSPPGWQPGTGDPFAAGLLGIVGDPSYRPRPQAMEAIGDRFAWDIVPYPRRRAGEPAIALAGGDHNWVPVQSKHPEEGYQVIKFLGEEEVQGALGRWRGVQPALKKARLDPAGFLKSPPAHMRVFNDIWDSGHYRNPFIFQYEDLQTMRAIDRIVVPAVGGERSVKDALAEANREANQLLRYGQKCFKPPWKRR